MENHFKNQSRSYAWFVILLSAAFLFYKYILQISPAVMTHDLMRTYSLTGTSLGFLVGFYFYTYMIMQIPSGILLDRYGPRKLTSLAILLCVIGTLLFSQTHSFVVACFARLLIGFGAAFATTSYMKLASIWFPPQYFALFSGLFGTACMTGAGTAEAPLAWLVDATGWRDTLLICAGSGLILFISFWLFVSDKNEKSVKVNRFSIQDFLSIFRLKSNWPLIFYGGLAFTPVSVFGGLWGVPFLMTAYALPKASAASTVSLAFFGFALGGIFIGWIGKFFEKQLKIVTIGTTAALFFLAIVLYVPHLSIFALKSCIFFFGFSSSSFLLSFAIAKNINSAALVGTVIGVINMGDPLCGAFAEPMIGKILDLNWDGALVNQVRQFSVHAYQLGLSVLAGYLVLALICCYFVNENERAKKSLATETIDPVAEMV